MTPEEATQLYNIEQHKYYEYCGYVVSYQNKIGEYQSERQNKCVQVENKQTEIQKNKGNTAQLPNEQKYDIIDIWKDK